MKVELGALQDRYDRLLALRREEKMKAEKENLLREEKMKEGEKSAKKAVAASPGQNDEKSGKALTTSSSNVYSDINSKAQTQISD